MAEPKSEVFIDPPIREELAIIDDMLDQCDGLETATTIESLDEQLIQALREAGY